MPQAGNPHKAAVAVIFAIGAAILAAAGAVIVRALNRAVHPFCHRVPAPAARSPSAVALFGEHIALTTLFGGGLICCAVPIAARSGKTTSG